MGGINQEEAAGTPKSCLQRISLGNFKGREALILPRFCVCPAQGPASTAVDHLWQLPGVTDAPVLRPREAAFQGRPSSPRAHWGAQPGWCVRTFNCILSLAPNKRGENLIPFTTKAREAQRAKSLVLGTQHSWDCNSGDLTAGKGACLGSL